MVKALALGTKVTAMFLFLSAEEAAGFVSEGEAGSALCPGQEAQQPCSVSGRRMPPELGHWQGAIWGRGCDPQLRVAGHRAGSGEEKAPG